MAKEVSPNTILHRAPTERPPFTLSQLKKAIPPHCFQRSLLRSSSYLFFDLIVVFVLLYLAHCQIPKLPSPYNYIAWPLYCRCQTAHLGALWVIAHECGHHAFSDYQLLNDTVGFILHSMLLVPYFSFKYSHRRHHSNAASLEFDEVIVPRPKSSLRWFSKYLNDPLYRVMFLFVVLTIGWPMYMVFNFYGRQYPRFASHYDPYSPIYSARERAFIFLSDAGILAAFYIYYRLAQEFSWGSIAVIYGVPLLILNCAFVMITYLQHTHPALPHYDSSEWDWLRGALSTVDRNYGFFNKVIHNITDTHVVHHLFPMLPHYNAVEATEAIKPVLGEYYQFDDTNPIIAMWRYVKECVYVNCDEGEKSKGVYWFTNKF